MENRVGHAIKGTCPQCRLTAYYPGKTLAEVERDGVTICPCGMALTLEHLSADRTLLACSDEEGAIADLEADDALVRTPWNVERCPLSDAERLIADRLLRLALGG